MQRVGIIVPEGFQMLGLAPQSIFEFANRSAGKDVYDVRARTLPERPCRRNARHG